MAEPSGAKKRKNGKKVYSMTSNAIAHRKRLKLGEYADDYVAAAAPAPTTPDTPPESVSAPGGYSTETIGVVTTVEPIPEVTPHLDDFTGEEPPIYRCLNCKATIQLSDLYCPICEEQLDWSGIG